MLLAIVLSIIVIGAVIVGTVYSSIIPFFAIIGNTADYNIAYYGAVGSTERALLSLRYHKAGYEGWGGFSNNSAVSGVMADYVSGSFGKINKNANGMYWSITSLSSGSIPMASGGDIEALLQGTGSQEFNELGYDGLIELPLYYDTSLAPNERYTSGVVATLSASNGIYIQGTLRLPPKVLEGFGGTSMLDTANDIDNDDIKDDIVVNRSLKGTNGALNESFSIIPTIKVDYNAGDPIYDFENAIRESHINNVSDIAGTNTPNFFMGDASSNYNFNVILQPYSSLSNLTGHNAIPANNLVVNTSDGFDTILNDSNLVEPSLSFNLVNRLVSSSTTPQIFPFLEYQINVCELGNGCHVPVSDRYFHIDGAGAIGQYKVHIRISKPVIRKDSSSDFAIIF